MRSSFSTAVSGTWLAGSVAASTASWVVCALRAWRRLARSFEKERERERERERDLSSLSSRAPLGLESSVPRLRARVTTRTYRGGGPPPPPSSSSPRLRDRENHRSRLAPFWKDGARSRCLALCALKMERHSREREREIPSAPDAGSRPSARGTDGALADGPRSTDRDRARVRETWPVRILSWCRTQK